MKALCLVSQSVCASPCVLAGGLMLGVRSPPGCSLPVVNRLHILPTVSLALTSKLRSCFGIMLEGEYESCSVVLNSLRPHGLYSPWNSLGQNTGVGSLSLLQGIFPTQGSNPGLPHCRQILYQLSHRGSPRILEWVASSISRGSSQPRNRTRVSCIAGRFFTN